MLKRIVLLLLSMFWISKLCPAQGTTGEMVVSTDSVFLHGPTSKQVVGYQYRAVTFLFDFTIFRAELVRLSERGYNVTIVKETIRQLDAEIQNRDTAYFDQAVFDRLNWVPLEYFVCDQVLKGGCLVIDTFGVIHRLVIRKHTLQLYNGRISWSGWRYFLPKPSMNSFWKCMESES